MTSEKIERLADMNDYDIAYGTWDFDGKQVPVASQYRIGWRRMAATTGFRTLYPAIIPPGSVHVDPVHSAGSPSDVLNAVTFGISASSLVIDFFARSLGVSDLRGATVGMLPTLTTKDLPRVAVEKYLKLNSLTSSYAPLWERLLDSSWRPAAAYRFAKDREIALAWIDAFVAHSFGLTADELCMVYRTQFPVMHRYDSEDRYDRNGRKVPKEVMKLEAKLKDGEQLPEVERTWTHPQSGVEYVFEYPFEPFDRENAYREAFDAIESSID